MNLLCPNCQKMLQVPEQYAGQLMKCPLCTGTFTVPALPQAPAPPPPPPQFTPPQNIPQPPPDLGMGGAAAPNPQGAPSLPPAGYTHQRSYTISSRLVSWIAPLCLIGIFVFLFFSWVGMYPASVGAATQTGWQAAFGGYYVNEVWQDANRDDLEYLKNLGMSVWLVFFLVVLLPTLVIAVGTTLIHLRLVPIELPPSLMNYWSFRPLLVSLLCLGSLVFLVLQLMGGFTIEKDSWTQAEKMAKALPGYREPATPEQRFKFQLDQGKEYGKFNLERTSWLTLALILLVVALLGSLLDYWTERRGPQAPPPRIDILT